MNERGFSYPHPVAIPWLIRPVELYHIQTQQSINSAHNSRDVFAVHVHLLYHVNEYISMLGENVYTLKTFNLGAFKA